MPSPAVPSPPFPPAWPAEAILCVNSSISRRGSGDHSPPRDEGAKGGQTADGVGPLSPAFTPLDREDISAIATDGFAAKTAVAIVIETASRLGIPVSTTHVISSAILGVDAIHRASAVRRGIAGRIVAAWVVTIPVCVTTGWALYQLLHLRTGAKPRALLVWYRRCIPSASVVGRRPPPGDHADGRGPRRGRHPP